MIILPFLGKGFLESYKVRMESFSFGRDMAQDIAVDQQGNVYVTGYGFDKESHFDFVTIKYDSEGKLIWAKRYNGPANSSDYAQALEVDQAGSVYVVGHSNGIDSYLDATIVKYDQSGRVMWARRYEGPGNRGDWAYDVKRSPDGGIVVAGYSFGRGTEHDYLILKYNPVGDLLWAARYNPPRNRDDVCESLAIDTKGNVYVTGIIRNVNTEYDMATLKYDARGRQEWLAFYAGPELNYDAAKDIGVDSEGNAYVTGYSFVGETEYDIVTVKYDTEGHEKWTKTHDGPTHRIDCGLELLVLPDGGVLVAGVSLDPVSGEDCLLIRYDGEGNQMWLSGFNGPGNGADVPRSLALDANSNMIVAGYSRGKGTGRDFFVIKVDVHGRQIWQQLYDGGSNDEDVTTAMVVDPEGCIYVTGYSYDPETDFGYMTLKLGPDGQLVWTARYPGNR
jgi:uncharacterized delta-60 repeat protein